MNRLKKENPKNKNISAGKALLRLMFILVLTGIVVVFFPDELSKIAGELKRTAPEVLTAILLLAFLRFMLEGLVIRTAAGQLKNGSRLSVKDGICCAFYCEFFRLFTLGTGSGIAEIYYLSRSGLEPARGTGVTLVQYTFHKLVITLCGIAALFLCKDEIWQTLSRYRYLIPGGCILALAICAVILLAATCRPLSDFVLSLAEKPAARLGGKWPEKLKKGRQQVFLLQSEGRLLLHEKKRLASLIILNILKMSCLYMIPWITLGTGSISAGGIIPGNTGAGSLSPGRSWLICALIYLLAGVIPAPSGYGSTEFLFLMLYGPFTGSAKAGAAAVLQRLAVSIFPAAAGGIIFLFQKKGKAAS